MHCSSFSAMPASQPASCRSKQAHCWLHCHTHPHPATLNSCVQLLCLAASIADSVVALLFLSGMTASKHAEAICAAWARPWATNGQLLQLSWYRLDC
jgi:hypothetical protein